MNRQTLTDVMRSIHSVMRENREHLIELDARNGDGDLGISMDAGFGAICDYLAGAEEEDLGRLLMKCSSACNEAAPSTMGTILSVGLMGMARALKGKTDAPLGEVAAAMKAGLDNIMQKAGSKPGEKTILDALCPAVDALSAHADSGAATATAEALKAAEAGREATKEMKSVHGRAAYYGEKSIGMVDGGAVAGALIFQGIKNAF